MPIECNVFQNGSVQRERPIEAGTYHTYRSEAFPIGTIVLAGCFEEDNGGRIYVVNEKQLENLSDPGGTIYEDKLEKHQYEIIPPGITVPLTLFGEDETETTILFTHQSMN